MTKKQMAKLIEVIRGEVLKDPAAKGATEVQINDAIMDVLFEGFKAGDLYRTDLAIAADLLGFELDKDFMNDPHPDPITLKKGK